MNDLSIYDLISMLSKYSDDDIKMILKAYKFAEELHKGQIRQSGEEYIIHPLNVAIILAEMNADVDTICAGLLHDTLEDTVITKEEITEEFNSEVAKLVDGVTKISKLKYMTKEKVLAKSHQKILLAMAKDVRVILVKLVDRLHNMRTMQFQSPEKQKRIAQETLDLYAPLAHRLGMYRLKAELEDLSYKYTNPDEYTKIFNMIKRHKAAREEDISRMVLRLDEILKENNFSKFDIKSSLTKLSSLKFVKSALSFARGGWKISPPMALLTMSASSILAIWAV